MGLDDFRERINEIDQKIIEILSQRASVIQELAEYKKQHKIPIIDIKREKEVLENVRIISLKNKLNPDSVEKIFSEILQESKNIQRNVF
jgi:monofunctional chorismate mutase